MGVLASALHRARAACAASTLRSGAGSYEEVISDLLTDLMHLVDHLNLEESFEDLLDRAEMNYAAEKQGE